MPFTNNCSNHFNPMGETIFQILIFLYKWILFIIIVSFTLSIKNVITFEGNLSIYFYLYLLFMASSLDFPHPVVMHFFKNSFYNRIK